MKKAILIFLALLLSLFPLTACTEVLCRHEWQDATCTQPKTCKRCGKTEGKPIPHDYEDTTCVSQKPCKMCGTYDGMVLTHEFRADGKVCLLCGFDQRTPAERFSETLSEALSAYFDCRAQATEDAGFAAEAEKTADCRTEVFDDETLAFWVAQYYENLDAIVALLPAYSDSEQWAASYDDWLYLDRAQILYHLDALLSLDLPPDVCDAYNAILADGERVDSVGALCETIDFHNISGTGERQTYEALVENTAQLDFKEFHLELALCTEDGATVEVKTITIKNWQRGAEKSLRFTTSTKFKTIEIKYATWVNAEA